MENDLVFIIALKELLTEYPWLKYEIIKVNDKFKMLNTPMGKIMLGKADIAEMSKIVTAREVEMMTAHGVNNNITMQQNDSDFGHTI